LEYDVYLFCTAGYGKSTGQPSEKGLQMDADAVLKYAKAHPRLANSPIIVFGRSLGGAVSVYLAHKHPDLVKAVILENTFLSVGAMVDVLMPFFKPIKWLVLNIKWNSDEKICDLVQPILFISGAQDELVRSYVLKHPLDHP
jgi:abhydrolase domain-containing protein 13